MQPFTIVFYITLSFLSQSSFSLHLLLSSPFLFPFVIFCMVLFTFLLYFPILLLPVLLLLVLLYTCCFLSPPLLHHPLLSVHGPVTFPIVNYFHFNLPVILTSDMPTSHTHSLPLYIACLSLSCPIIFLSSTLNTHPPPPHPHSRYANFTLSHSYLPFSTPLYHLSALSYHLRIIYFHPHPPLLPHLHSRYTNLILYHPYQPFCLPLYHLSALSSSIINFSFQHPPSSSLPIYTPHPLPSLSTIPYLSIITFSLSYHLLFSFQPPLIFSPDIHTSPSPILINHSLPPSLYHLSALSSVYQLFHTHPPPPPLHPDIAATKHNAGARFTPFTLTFTIIPITETRGVKSVLSSPCVPPVRPPLLPPPPYRCYIPSTAADADVMPLILKLAHSA